MKIISVAGARPNFMKIAPIFTAIENSNLNNPDVIPRVSVEIGISEYIRKYLGVNRVNYPYFLLGRILVFAPIMFAVALLRKRGGARHG